VAKGIVIDADSRRRHEAPRRYLPFVAQHDVAGTNRVGTWIEANEAIGIGVVPVLLIAGAPVDFVPLPGLDAVLEIESQILQLAADIGIVDVVPVVGELDHGFAPARTGSRPTPLQIAAVIIGMPLHSIDRRLDTRIAQRILPV